MFYYANRPIAVFFVIMAIYQWYWPGFNGVLFEPSPIPIGESRIIAAIFAVGAALVWFIRPPRAESGVGE